jgi:hypothetical protein
VLEAATLAALEAATLAAPKVAAFTVLVVVFVVFFSSASACAMS